MAHPVLLLPVKVPGLGTGLGFPFTQLYRHLVLGKLRIMMLTVQVLAKSQNCVVFFLKLFAHYCCALIFCMIKIKVMYISIL